MVTTMAEILSKGQGRSGGICSLCDDPAVGRITIQLRSLQDERASTQRGAGYCERHVIAVWGTIRALLHGRPDELDSSDVPY